LDVRKEGYDVIAWYYC